MDTPTTSAAPLNPAPDPAHPAAPKVLVIRFSSFGDIVACLPVAQALRAQMQAHVHWVVRADLQELVKLDPDIQLWPLPRHQGWAALKVLWALAKNLYTEHFTHIYDAHASLRSHILMIFLNFLAWRDPHLSLLKKIKKPWHFARRSKSYFKRLLLFNLQVNLFPRPFREAISFLKPLAPWGIAATYTPCPHPHLPPLPDFVCRELWQLESLSKLTQTEEKKVQEATAGNIVLPPPEVLVAAEEEKKEQKENEQKEIPAAAPTDAPAVIPAASVAPPTAEKPLPYYVAIAPSSAWPLKRWPLAYWKELINLNPHVYFIVLGGPQDHFCQELVTAAPDHVSNCAGHLSLLESCAVVQHAHVVISADTGILHVADYLQKPGIVIMGPAAFGFPSGKTLRILETNLPCRPCTKEGNSTCYRSIQQECLTSISPLKVSKVLEEIICETFKTTPEDLAQKQEEMQNAPEATAGEGGPTPTN